MAFTAVLPPSSVSLLLSSILFLAVLIALLRRRRPLTTTHLRGPKSINIFGVLRVILAAKDHGLLFETWERKHGAVFQLPGLFGRKEVVLCDPKAIAHFYLKDTYTYRQTPVNRFAFEHFFGRNLLWAEADVHKRQRKVLSSAFSNAAIRIQTPVFFDSAHKLTASWDQTLQSVSSSDGVVIDVQQWMSRVSLDSIGIAGFSYDFGSLSGRSAQVVAAFETFGSSTRHIITDLAILLAPIFPWLIKLPGPRKTALENLATVISQIATDLLKDAKKDSEYGAASAGSDKSIMGALGPSRLRKCRRKRSWLRL
ncbi:putative cytochrome p450 [Lyophyllum shimeji]|uniref:Cytochrome p450 n=1 Tax=Lyophyllum shimeji TaxID=47721 RepID=A0A9P3UH44_LYOSH|nr:putative cytochrome p450 [Lyophyllum shimeji]